MLNVPVHVLPVACSECMKCMKLPMSTVVSRDSCMFCSYALMTMTNFHSTVDQNPLIKTPCYFTFLTAFIGTDLVSSG